MFLTLVICADIPSVLYITCPKFYSRYVIVRYIALVNYYIFS